MNYSAGFSGRAIRARLSALRGMRLANDSAALLLAAVGLAAGGTAIVAALFWSGWVLFVLVPPLALLAWRWLGGLRQRALAYTVEAGFPTMAGRLVAALDLARQAESREGYSSELRQAAVMAVSEELAGLPLARLVRRRRLAWTGLAALVGLALFFGGRAALATRFELGLTNAFARDRLAVEFAVTPGDTAVLPGTEVEVACRVTPAGVFRSVSFEAAGKPRARVALTDGVARVPVRASRDQRFRFRVLGAASAEHRIRVLEPLAIEELAFTCDYPDYSGLADARMSGPDLTALKGSRLSFAGRANHDFVSGRLAFAGDTVALAPGTDGAFAGEFRIRGDERGTFELQDDRVGAFQQCGFVTVRAVPDETPMVRVMRPGRDVDLPMSMQLALVVNSLDDYGLSALWLRYGRDSLDERLRIKGLGGRREDTTTYTWDLSDLGLLPGDRMRYRLEVTDNDDVSGPKTGVSDVFELRFPTMDEIYSAAVRRTEQTSAELAPIRENQEKLSEEVARIGEQAKSAGELSWEEKQALGEMLSEQQDLAADISQLRDEVREMMDNMYEGVAFDEETMQRLGDLQKLLGELMPRDLAQSLERLREKMDASDPEMRAALEQFQLDQEKLRESLDQALEFLKQVMEEQRLEALARTAEELAKTEQDISDRQGDGAEQLSREQEAASSALDSLLSEMSKLASEMSDSAMAESLAALSEQAAQDSLSQQAQDAANQFQQGKPSEGKQQAGKVAGKLGKMAQSLSKMSSQLKKKRSSEVAQKIAGAVEELLMLSREQEALEDRTGPGEGEETDIAREMGLHDATGVVAESLAALSSRTMAIPGRLIGTLGQAQKAMAAASQDMVESRAGQARVRMAEARTRLDGAAGDLLAALAEAEQGGGMSGGFEGLMQSLSQMAAGQMAVNAGMSGIPIPMPGGMTPGMAQALGRLLAQQGALRERLQGMLDEMGGQRPGLTSSLEGLLDEMKSVEEDMASLNITRDLIERQEGVLSHLLDAQRSVRQQGNKEERESETAKEFERERVPVLPEDRGERNRLLREELMRALRDGKLGRFEPQIRAYFETLLQEK